MRLGKIGGCSSGTYRSRASFTLRAPPRPSAPPVTASERPRSVVTHAKRSSKRLKKQDNSDSGIDDDASGWDDALANIPTEDEAAWASEGATEQDPSDLNASASAERTASQGPDPSTSAPSTSYTTRRDKGDGSKKGQSTVLTLAEYNLLMDAVTVKEKELAAQREKAAREAAGTVALVVPEVSPLETSRQGFQAFALDGGDLELLVAETADGRLLLSDSYVAAKAASPDGSGASSATVQYSRPKLEGEMPSEPLIFQAIPWTERGSSDMFKRKAATNKVKKVYFIGLEPSEQHGLRKPIFDLDSVFVFDGKSRVLSRSEVRLVGTLPLLEPVLRIRPSGLTLEESYLLPDPIEVSMNTASNLADMSPEELAERMEELEKAAESLDEFDEMPDVPSVDMM
ncbi:hypothetical protein Vretimale_2359 [Volvox reticuliferus]|uniref:Uncharacterized protein n=2 Tax=Volvox reticuliferus TaxID=1737510 RepID=A0A8J4C4Q8_9CHLO|nr:hypothetical protein Vretifemale_4646 [Volvox reticuliferus]GIL96555.1 hypothetical protein Vretimale_2359 [Volvox reticuliferus]